MRQITKHLLLLVPSHLPIRKLVKNKIKLTNTNVIGKSIFFPNPFGMNDRRIAAIIKNSVKATRIHICQTPFKGYQTIDLLFIVIPSFSNKDNHLKLACQAARVVILYLKMNKRSIG